MSNALKTAPPPQRPGGIAPPPPRTTPPAANDRENAEQGTTEAVTKPAAPKVSRAKFTQVKEDERVQFNKRVTQGVADGYEMLAIRTRKKVPELIAEGLELLEKHYGKV